MSLTWSMQAVKVVLNAGDKYFELAPAESA